MAWCEKREVDYILGVARNPRLEAKISPMLGLAEERVKRCGRTVRLYGCFDWRTRDSWSRTRRVIAKGEVSRQGKNPRFVVTTLPCRDIHDAKRLYRKVYCARGDMENRIKEQQLHLFADRTSAHTMRANQVRLYMSSMAYVLLSAIRRLALAGTRMARAQCGTIRLRLLKIGARIRVSVRRVWVHMSSGYPDAELFELALRRLRTG